MKIWHSYGAEHSMNLVIIGRFKEIADAEEFKQEVEALSAFLQKLEENKNFDFGSNNFSDDVLNYLTKRNLCCFTVQQIEQFLYPMEIEQKGLEVKITSDDDLNALITLMILKGAKLEIFSAHDYPEE